MRVAQKSLYETTRFQLQKITEEMTEANLTVSTGKRINNLKDDPVGITQVLSLKSNLSNLDQLKRNTATGKTWLNSGESSLTSVLDIISESKTLAISMRNTTADADMQQAAAETIRGFISQIETLANTQVQGQYIFGGTKTDAVPFSLDSQSNPTSATYAGNSTAFSIKSGKDTTVEVGHDGDPLFTSLFNSMISLYSDLQNGDESGIGAGIDNLDTEFNTINNAIAGIGAKSVRIATKEKIIEDLDLSYNENRADLEETDIIDAISKLQATELAYQAALTSSSKLMKLSLVDFL